MKNQLAIFVLLSFLLFASADCLSSLSTHPSRPTNPKGVQAPLNGGLYTVYQIGNSPLALGQVNLETGVMEKISSFDPLVGFGTNIASTTVPGEPLMIFPTMFNYSVPYIVVVNVTNGSIIKSIPTVRNLENLQYNPNTKEILAFNPHTHSVVAYDLAKGTNRSVAFLPPRIRVFQSSGAFDPCTNIFTMAAFTGNFENKNMFVNINVETRVVTNGTGPIIVLNQNNTNNNYTDTFQYAPGTPYPQNGCHQGIKQPLIGTIVNRPRTQDVSYYFGVFDPDNGSYKVHCGTEGCPETPLGAYASTGVSGYIPPPFFSSQSSTETGAYGGYFVMFWPLHGSSPNSPPTFAIFDASTGNVDKLLAVPGYPLVWSAGFVYF